MINYKQILEAVNKGIQFALDDFDDEETPIQNIKAKQIQNRDYTKEYLDFQKLIIKLKNKVLTKQELEELIKLSKLSGLKYTVNSKEELRTIIKYIMANLKNLTPNLNWIDTSRITDMSYLFIESEFKGDISEWNVSNVESMYSMFAGSDFNSDISKWNVSRVADMRYMFQGCPFNHDISMWDVWRSNKDDLVKTGIFAGCPINREYRPKFNNE